MRSSGGVTERQVTAEQWIRAGTRAVLETAKKKGFAHRITRKEIKISEWVSARQQCGNKSTDDTSTERRSEWCSDNSTRNCWSSHNHESECTSNEIAPLVVVKYATYGSSSLMHRSHLRSPLLGDLVVKPCNGQEKGLVKGTTKVPTTFRLKAVARNDKCTSATAPST